MLETLWKDFHQQLLNFIKSKVSDEAAAEDILQEVFIKVHKNLSQLQDDKKLSSWLYQICRNAITDYYRQLKTKDDDFDLHSLIADQPSSNSRLHINRCLQKLIQDMPENYSDIMMDSELENMKQQQLAEKHGLTLPAVKSRIKRGRAQLKDSLQSCCDFEFTETGPKADCKTHCGCDD